LTFRDRSQCAAKDLPHSEDVKKHRFFSTNNYWLHLERLKLAIEADGLPSMPLVERATEVDVANKNARGLPALQLEMLLASSIASLRGSKAVAVPRARFCKARNTAELLLLRSDAYVLTADLTLELAPSLQLAPSVKLDSAYDRLYQLDAAIPQRAPSLRECTSLTVKGQVIFCPDVVAKGDVTVFNFGNGVPKVHGPITGEVDAHRIGQRQLKWSVHAKTSEGNCVIAVSGESAKIDTSRPLAITFDDSVGFDAGGADQRSHWWQTLQCTRICKDEPGIHRVASV
jgi:UDP-N-acetylglucosamine pyrophosphorylase